MKKVRLARKDIVILDYHQSNCVLLVELNNGTIYELRYRDKEIAKQEFLKIYEWLFDKNIDLQPYVHYRISYFQKKKRGYSLDLEKTKDFKIEKK